MMVNCPKCGFSQPKDQYCAKCGVDMVAYRPAEKPLVAKVIGNTFFQLLLLVALIGAGFDYVRYQNKAELATRIAELEDTESTQLVEQRPLAHADSASQGDSAKAAPPEPPPEPRKVELVVASAPAPAPPALAGTNPAAAAPAATEIATATQTAAPHSTGDSQAASATDDRPAAPTQIRFLFAEVQKPFLAEIVANARDGGGYGAFSAGVVQNLESQIKAGNGAWRSLEPESNQPLRFNQMIPIYKGALDESIGQNIGLTLEVIPLASAPDDSGTRLSIRARRLFRDPRAVPPIAEVSFPEDQYMVPRGGAVFMSGLLPKRQFQDDEARLYNSVDVLKILNLESYKNGLTDFIVFVEPR